MKVTISYLPEETREALAALEALRKLHPSARVRRSDAHPPFLQIYLRESIKKGCNQGADMV